MKCQTFSPNPRTRGKSHHHHHCSSLLLYQCIVLYWSRTGELRTQKSKSHLVKTQSLNVLLLKPGVGQYIAIHATRTARDFFLAYFYPSGPFTCIFSNTSPDFFLCWMWLTLVRVQARRIKQVTLPDACFRVECPRNINRLKKIVLF